jgi:cell wall-associated NlpC family hydrolase
MTAHLRAPARFLLVAAALGVAPLGLTRLAPAQAADTAPAAATVPVAATALAAAAAPARAAAAAAASKKLRLNAWHYAVRQRGKPYEWGGTGPHGFDCSGLVYASYRSRGVALPRTTYGMLGNWRLVRVRKSKARRGDLAFFGSGHVELYDHGSWTYGAADAGSRIGFHRMSRFWHPTKYYRVRR